MKIIMVAKTVRKFNGKEFHLYWEYGTKAGARKIATEIRNAVPDKGYFVRVAKTMRGYGVYIRDEIQKPWRMG